MMRTDSVSTSNRHLIDLIVCNFGNQGLTETCAGLSIQASDDFRNAVQGVPIPTCEVKLDSTPEVMDKAGLPYLSTVSTVVQVQCW